MQGTKQEAQATYEEKRVAYGVAFEELKAARVELDEHLREESYARYAVYLGFPEGDEDGVRAARALMKMREEEKAAARADFVPADNAADGVVGGIQ